METLRLTSKHEQVIEALQNKHLTSFQILNKVKNVSLILVVYNIIDELKSLGLLKSYIKDDKKYHCLT
jgi:Fe2+ or Zn2+ uptake regulation protein